ncbi:5-(carboxyamino)imidazole ribonucleotide synthase [Bacillus salipaludis]|uniref:N5-carboxyaminoimidazole ribonucleotide synthase n=1 Tax=Bacillus salipaludis TaxID=2547811 RepID=A0A4R5VIH7_9BACI|nr:5-(carboxyamino)imidazole ribonucleotide synthase [Bacillus salipaludis]MDQ6595581.1 5-(carboxyamino)imidazole ribonucleotide synthase [Bacillus salipaludis]TDK56180.1 5-(carboxyamino)imidazole ribonucleotide synthase [Bacillus salipaludis]
MSNKIILPGSTIGIIGGGQLGRMMALSAKAQGYRIAVLEPTSDSPCGQVADFEVIGAYDDREAISKLAVISDVITYEFENIDADTLEWICERAYVPQGPKLLTVTQDRIKEKAAIQQAGVEVAPYEIINSLEDLFLKIQAIGYPAVLKTARGGYDGKGQLVIKVQQDLQKAEELIKQGACVLEKWIPFEKEISVIVTRKLDGETAIFPVAENIHQDNILHQTIVPARISEGIQENAIQKAKQIADSLNLVGTLAVEMFLTSDGTIYINELAPRPHNSGHYSIEACETSQFEQHVRAICNLPLGSTKLLKSVVMVNLLGEHLESMYEEIPGMKDWKVHLYGKKEPKIKRKMGHVTILRDNVTEALTEIEQSGIWKVTEKIGG